MNNFGNKVEKTIPDDIRVELEGDARMATSLGESVSGEPLLFVPGTRAWEAFKKLIQSGYEMIVRSGSKNPLDSQE